MDMNAYDEFAEQYRQKGYDAHPIGVGVKWPQVIKDGAFVNMLAWQQIGRSPAPHPQPGAGIGIRLGKQRNGLYLIVIDWDNDKLSNLALGGSLYSPVSKVGKRGFSSFFVSRTKIPSKSIKDKDGNMLVEILSDGDQTVLPPSVHPDLNRPYFWLDSFTLLGISMDGLPELPLDYLEQIDALIAEAGFKREPEKAPSETPVDSEFDDGDPFQVLNGVAIKNLPAWVPDLFEPNKKDNKFRQKSFRYPAYEVVATWRPSTTGRPLAEREPGLSITSKGIVDFPVDQGYSPINLVMAAHACDRSAAYDWLKARLMPQSELEFDLDKLREFEEAPSIEPPDGGAGDGDGADKVDEDKVAKLTGEFWEHGDPLPEQLPMLVPYFVPAIGVGYIGGEWGSFKTFVLNDLAVAVASVGAFAGQQVSGAGCVIQVELEGSQNEVRITGSAYSRGVKGKLPIRVFTHMPPKIIGSNKRVTPEWRQWCRAMKIQADRMAKAFGLPVRMVTIDPVNTVAGWTDETSSAEGQAVYEGLLYLSKQIGCVVVASDHYGKAPNAGLRGTSVKETAALFILGTSQRDADIAARRFLEIRKMKNGQQNIAMDFFMEEFEFSAVRKVEKDGVTTLETMEIRTLAIRWDGELHPVEHRDRDQAKKKSAGELALDVLREMVSNLPDASSLDGHRVPTASWFQRLQKADILHGDPKKSFGRIKASLLREGRIREDTETETIWIGI